MASSSSNFPATQAEKSNKPNTQALPISLSRDSFFTNPDKQHLDLITTIIDPYLDQYAPCLWLVEQKEEEIEAENRLTTEIKFRLTPEGLLEYTLHDPSGELVTKDNKINPQKELNTSFQENPLTQNRLNQLWPTLWKILSSRGHTRYDMEETNKLATTSEPRYQALKVTLTEHLLHLVLWGNKDEVENMIKINPRLLFESNRNRAPIQDLSGRLHQGTAYQLARGAEDKNINYDNEGMAEMLEFYFIEFFGAEGEAERQRQEDEYFPEGFEAEAEQRNTEDLLALQRVIAAVAAIPEDRPYEHPDYDAAIQLFRDYLANQATIVTRSGYHFNNNLYQTADDLYNANYDRFSTPDLNWDSPKNLRFSRQILGTIQRYLTACAAQAHAQGLYYIVEKKEPLKRSFKFSYGGGSILPLDMDREWRLGHEYIADGVAGGGRVAGGRCRADAPVRFFQTYVKQKQTAAGRSTKPTKQKKGWDCAVM